MIYIYGYLGVGVVILAVLFGARRLTESRKPESLSDLYESVNPDRSKLSYRILRNIIAPLMVAVVVVAVWPVAVYMKLKELLQKTGPTDVAADREFAVEHEHLQEELTSQEIERREVVIDPLKAAPELPFGHLNVAWKGFLDKEAHGSCELWSFSAPWQTVWGRKELRSGYVMVKDGKPGAYFLTEWRDVQDEAGVDGGAGNTRADDVPGWLRSRAD